MLEKNKEGIVRRREGKRDRERQTDRKREVVSSKPHVNLLPY